VSVIQPGAEPNFSVGQASQQQFMQYAIALTFTVLGFSIQTSHFGQSRVADSLEILAWVLLFTSGIRGLLRWERIPHIFQMYGYQSSSEATVAELERARAAGTTHVKYANSGEVLPVDAALKKQKGYSLELDGIATPKIEKAGRHYKWQRWTFALGFVALIAARAYIPVNALALSIANRTAYSIPK
jgi:hypothetical protein